MHDRFGCANFTQFKLMWDQAISIEIWDFQIAKIEHNFNCAATTGRRTVKPATWGDRAQQIDPRCAYSLHCLGVFGWSPEMNICDLEFRNSENWQCFSFCSANGGGYAEMDGTRRFSTSNRSNIHIAGISRLLWWDIQMWISVSWHLKIPKIVTFRISKLQWMMLY